MRNNLTPLRPGLTAIAAVLALSATPSFAQDAQTAPVPDAPVISAPAPIIVAPAVTAAPAPLQQSVTTEDSAAPLAEPAAPMATRSPVVVHTVDSSTSAPVAKATAPKQANTIVKRIAPEPLPAPTPAAAPRIQTLTQPAPAPVSVAKTSTTAATTAASNDDREIELAGIGAIGLLALIGGAVALTRRKRDDEDAVIVTSAAPTATVEPASYRRVDATPITAESATIEGAPTTALHDDFDLSRYGPFAQAAYRGPTEDNPSLSLRHRLKRARFMDQRARDYGDYVAGPAATADRKPIAQSLFGAKLKDGLRSLRPQPGFRPAFG